MRTPCNQISNNLLLTKTVTTLFCEIRLDSLIVFNVPKTLGDSMFLETRCC